MNHLANKPLELAFERAVQLLVECMPIGIDRKKPVLMHSLRVGMFLYEHDYSDDVVIAGLLHDVIEWTEFPKEKILDHFGQVVFDIVTANTKDLSITDKTTQRHDMVRRSAECGKDAMIVKCADVLDSLRYYRLANNEREIEHCLHIVQWIQESLKKEWSDPIFELVRNAV